ncbi:MAG: helix-turn-helix transcriptional regulator [Gemmataceae bacterium]
MDTLQQQFGSLIRRRRLAVGLGQEALADQATLHRTHVSLLERGKRMPSLLVVKKLAAALGTTMASLMEELESTAADPAGDQGVGQSSPSTTPTKKATRKPIKKADS